MGAAVVCTFLIRFVLLKIFTRILRSLNLPVGSNQVLVPRFLTNAYDIGHAVVWITAMMVRFMGLRARVVVCPEIFTDGTGLGAVDHFMWYHFLIE